MADVSVTEAGPNEKLVAFEVPEADLDSAKTKAARRISQEVKIRGFRPGKAPRSIVEATVGAERVRSEAIDEFLPDLVGKLLEDNEIEAAVPPSLQSLEDVDDGIKVEVRVTTWPTLEEVPEIHDRTVQVDSPEVSTEDIDAQIIRFLEQFASVEEVERAAEGGDYVMMSISATQEGEDVPEAAAAGLMYEVGSSGLIPALDDNLYGTSAGDVVTFDGPLPDGFGEKAGTEVTYTVTVADVREQVLPEVSDEWVAENTEFETESELRETLLSQMADMKRRSIAGTFTDLALDQLVDEVEIELPEALVRGEMDEVFHRFSHRLEDQKISLEDYFQVTGIEQEAFVADLNSQAERSLKTRLLLEAVIDNEGLEVSDEELGSVMEMVVASADDPETVRTALQSDLQRKNLTGDILRNKALEMIVNGARPVDVDGNEVDLSIEPPVVEADVVEAEVVDESAETEIVVEAAVVADEEE